MRHTPRWPAVAAAGALALSSCSGAPATTPPASAGATSDARTAAHDAAERFLAAMGTGAGNHACPMIRHVDTGSALRPGESGYASCVALVTGTAPDGTPVDVSRITDRLTFRPVLLAAPTVPGAKSPAEPAPPTTPTPATARTTPGPGPTDAGATPGPVPTRSAATPPAPGPVVQALQGQLRRLRCPAGDAATEPVHEVPASGVPPHAAPGRPTTACSVDGDEKFILGTAAITGVGVAAAEPEPAAGGSTPARYSVRLTFNRSGRNAYSTITSRLAREPDGSPTRRLAIVLDDQVISATDTRSVVTSGDTSITGGFSQAEATRLATDLRYAHAVSAIGRQGRITYSAAHVRETYLPDGTHAQAYLDIPTPLLYTDPGIGPPGILELVLVHGTWLVSGAIAEYAVSLPPAR